MKIAQGTLQDLDNLSVLFDDYRIFYGKSGDRDGAKKFLYERIVNEESVIFIARSDDRTLSGFTQLYPIFSSTRMKRLWLLNDLFVAPSFRGSGVSVALIDAAKRFAKDTEACGLVLETSKSNLVANKLYVRTGFEVDAEYNHYAWNE